MKTKAEIVQNWLPRYTGRPLESFGEYILLTNFAQYVELFAERFLVEVGGRDMPMQSATAEGITILNCGMGSAMKVGPAEGLPKEQWKLRSAKELLDLKICDMACGSGAFLVQACRYMAARLLEAWDQLERQVQSGRQQNFLHEPIQDNSIAVRITPYGDPSKGGLFEQVVPFDPDERQTYALRIVAQRCLYGVDKNHLAGEMAKLSLWLLTLAKDKPFEFLDHAIRCGDSLVGIQNLDQLRKFNLDGKGEDNRLYLQFLDEKIKEDIALRRQITEMQANTVEDVEAQDRMLREANEKIDRLKCAADLLISAEFVSGSAADKRAARDDAAIKVAVHFNDSDLPTFRREVHKALAGQVTFHWPLEFPEVIVERGGFDAFVGNPPFMPGKRISTTFGTIYETFLKSAFEKSKGAADLCCFFLRRAFHLTRSTGSVGLILTKSVAEGDSRLVGLAPVLDDGGILYWVWHELNWPGSATVAVSLVVVRRSMWQGIRILNEEEVSHINSSLDSSAEDEAFTLLANKGLCSDGIKIQGEGFIITEEERRLLVERCSRNHEVIVPYGGPYSGLYGGYGAYGYGVGAGVSKLQGFLVRFDYFLISQLPSSKSQLHAGPLSPSWSA